jgi:hypothetical protein
MKYNKYPNTIFVVGVSLLIALVFYAFSGASNDSIFAYPAPNSTMNTVDGYPGPTSGINNTSGYPAPNQTMSLNRGGECIPPIDPTSNTLRGIGICATPISLPTPTPSPTPNPGDSGMLNMTSSLTIQGNGIPDYQLISPGQDQIPGVTVTTKSLTYNGPLPSVPPAMPNRQSANSDLVDNWDLLFDEGFEGTFPQSGCVAFDNNSSDGYERYWGADDDRPLTGLKAGWPAKGGADGVEPTGDAYPDNLDSWLLCGPFDLSQADKFIVQYSFWHEIVDIIGDSFFFGISTDGTNFQGSASVGTTPSWIVKREHIQGVAGNSSVW